MPEGKFFLSLQGIQYCVEYLQTQKDKNEYLEKKERAEKKRSITKNFFIFIYSLDLNNTFL